ncbi:hypothetical protein C9374_008800 [Naegleria lovaniensis]|uniref:Uncharacterized protein n=1 Tax=Naegleria lovaniensis TaxID=51637 RepID=A0AA88GII6_NAELO|nr:uncharacterized protein C9374_008800 [Naegleria lovaniensis]KAG2377715.1 hypothetical protein C9374_008800 [Naegleria lovaniensis]
MNVRLMLFDFSSFSSEPLNQNWNKAQNSDHFLMNHRLLKSKMSYRRYRNVKPFQMKFEWIYTFGQSGVSGTTNVNLLSKPLDVKISYTHECILISDTNGIQVFDLYTKKHKASISLPEFSLSHLCIEEFYEEQRDALLVSGNNLVCKYNLQLLLQEAAMDQQTPYIWNSDLAISPQGMAIAKQLQQVFIGDNYWAYILVLDLKTGDVINFIELCSSPYGVDVTTCAEQPKCESLYVIATGKNADFCIEIMKKNSDNEFYTKKAQFCEYGQGIGKLKRPFGLVFDKEAKHVIVTDNEQHLIQIFTLEGNLVTFFGDKNNLNGPTGICLNELRGELFVCNTSDHTVRVFR